MQKSYTNQNPKVSVNILGYNCEKYIKNCLESVFSQTYKNIEITYIDNHSKDSSLSIVKSLSKDSIIKIIRNKKNTGYAKGNNIGINNSSGEYILILNPDILLDNNFVQQSVSFLNNNKKSGAVTGKLLKFKFNNNVVKKTNIIDSIGFEIFKNHRVIEMGGEEIDVSQFDKQKEVFGVSGAAPIIRRKALEEIKFEGKYLDEDFFAYKEDIDLSFRLRHAGWQCFYIPNALAWHDRWERGSGKENKAFGVIKKRGRKSDFVNYLSYRNHLLLLLKNEWLENFILYFPWLFFYEFKKFVYTLLFEPKNLKAWAYLFKNLSLTRQKRYVTLSKSKFKPSEVRSWLI